MRILDKINMVIKRNHDISELLYALDAEGFSGAKEEAEEIIKLMNLFINIMPALKNMGLEFPDGILEQQIKNLEDGLVHKDYILLGDTLRYEINDTLMVLKELVTEGVVKNEELL